MKSSIEIIIPTYNESKNIPILIPQIFKTLDKNNIKAQVVIVDDNSPDGTSKTAEDLGNKYPVKVIVRKEDRGLAKSVVDGINMTSGEIIGVMDADLSHPPGIIPKLIEAIENGADISIASRLVEGGGTEQWPTSRQINSYVATLLAKPITNVKDPMSGFFFFKRDVINNVKLAPRGYKILLEILAKGNYKKAVEVPFIFKDRTAGESKFTPKIRMEYIIHALSLYFYKFKKLFNK
ncbi:polyprenol monophosphomannose synthase [Candidatus Woesearchaeota archaeon]|nr:polyprenol monophosphomannose synthase [Candidatus Woesearchaeota archaeon]